MATTPPDPRSSRSFPTQHSAVGLYLLVIAIILPTIYLITAGDKPRSARNVVVVIAEGLSLPLVQEARAAQPGGLALDRMPMFGVTSASGAGGIAPDRAAVATALATGHVGPAGHLNALAEDDQLRLSRPTLLDIATERGRVVGLLTTDEISTPMIAAFGARTARATDEVEVLTQLLQRAHPSVILGGGRRPFDSGPMTGRARDAGYTVVRNATDLHPVSRNLRNILAVLADGPLPLYSDLGEGGMSLPKMVRMAVAGLRENDSGYFLVVHQGGIRRAALMHGKDLNRDGRVDAEDGRVATALAVKEVQALDETVALLQKISSGKDTLLVVVAAVDWGGLHLSADESGTVASWTAEGTTPVDVPVWIEGPGSDMLSGYQHLTRLFHIVERQLVQPL